MSKGEIKINEAETTSGSCSLYVSDELSDLPTINLVGEIDLAGAPGVYALIRRASQNGRRSIIINMNDLDFMDSSGLQVLLRLREGLRSHKQTVYLVGAKPQIKKLFRLTGFDQLFSVD